MPSPPLLAVVLAGGRSSRMGAPKALLDLRGAPLVAAHARALAPFGRVVVVLGCDADRIAAALPDGTWTVDPDWATTDMAARARFGLAGHDGPALVTPVDVLPEPDVVSALVEAGAPAVPLDRHGRRGHPLLLDAAAVARLLAPPHPTLRELSREFQEVRTGSLVCALDVDDAAAWARVTALGSPQPG